MSVVRTSTFVALLTATALLAPAQEDTSDRKRVVSNNLAAALADTMPKYNPPPPETDQAEDDGVDEDLMLKPKNGIVRLPRVVVEGTRPPIFTEREISTDQGLADIATKRYFSDASQALNKFHIPFLTMSQADLAMMMWQEDERLRLLKDLNDQAEISRTLGDEEEARELKSLSHETHGRREFLPAASALHRETKGN